MGTTETDILSPTGLATRLTRRAESEKLFGLFEKLKLLARHSEISVPYDGHGNLNPQVILARYKDLAANSEALMPLERESRNGFIANLRHRVPGLAEPIPAVTAGVSWRSPKIRGVKTHFLSLRFEREVAIRLEGEQADIWDEMQDMAGLNEDDKMLEWNAYEPQMLVASIGGAIQYSTISHIKSHIEKRGPFEVELLPIGEPRRPMD